MPRTAFKKGLAYLFLGLWLIALGMTFELNSYAMLTSNLISGFCLLTLGIWSIKSPRPSLRWVASTIALWLQFAPLLFWAKEPLAYLNDTLVSVLILTVALLIPEKQKEAPSEKPPGWSYNPSSYSQRLPIAALAFLCWMFARYMTAYQLGYIDTIWDPLFGEGTKDVITSKISQLFPVPDAGLGAMAYTLECVMALHGGQNRWRTIPWFVGLFALLVVPLGLVSTVLIILQPIAVGHWCFWCLLTAICMLGMIVLALDEVVAVYQFLKQGQSEGKSFSELFFKGGKAKEALPEIAPASPLTGVTFSWNLLLAILIGVWLMFSPHLLSITGWIADSDHIVGALTVVTATLALAEVTRTLRFTLILWGCWVLLTGFFCETLGQGVPHYLAGILLICLGLIKNPLTKRKK